MDKGGKLAGPTLRHAAIMIVVGYLFGFGVPFASFQVLPRLFDPASASRTSQNILASPGLLVFAIFAFLLAFVGDVVSAWGLYYLLRPASASLSLLVSALRTVYATMALAALLNLATAYRLLLRPAYLTALGRGQLDAQVQVAVAAFQFQFDFSLVVFGVHLVLLGCLVHRSGYVPRWLGIVLALNGAGWIAIQSAPYLFPGTRLGFLWITTAGELFLLVWLIGWGTRLRDPAVDRGAPPDLPPGKS
jgi:Domain of unknown function (DUF4386)